MRLSFGLLAVSAAGISLRQSSMPQDDAAAHAFALSLGTDASQEDRLEAIRGAFRHAWGNYHSKAWGDDELRPETGIGLDRQFKLAVTMVDSLDTLWLMGLKEEFAEAKEWLQKNLPHRIENLQPESSLFETTIRSLGGLLSAYDMSGDKVFLDLAVKLGTKINARISEDGIAGRTFFNTGFRLGDNTLAESGTTQLEMRYLAHFAADPSFSEKVNRFYTTVREKPSLDGLWPIRWRSGRGKITIGAEGDSFYEYLIKTWLQGGMVDDSLWEMYDKAVDGFEKHLVRKGPNNLTFIGNFFWNGAPSTPDNPSPGNHVEEMEHLTCFVPGWLAMGSMTKKGEPKRARRMELAGEIAKTCWEMYNQQPHGIGPERVKKMRMDLEDTDTREYVLRPEAVEAWFYMYEYTQEPQYRDYGWRTFLAMEKSLYADYGYASMKDVRAETPAYHDRMESFWLAETLKYLYLLQDPNQPLALDKYVFNTEGHPLRTFTHRSRPGTF